MLRVVPLAGMLIAISGSAAAAPALGPCEVATLEDYIALKNIGCDIGKYNFSNFEDSYSPFLPNTDKTKTDADSITVVPIALSIFGTYIFGFKFEQDNGYWTVTVRNQSLVDKISYAIATPLGSNIAIGSAFLTWPSGTDRGVDGNKSYVRVREIVPGGTRPGGYGKKCNNTEYCIELVAPSGETRTSARITPAAQVIAISDEVQVGAGDSKNRESRASLKSFTNLFVGTALPPVAGGPEPSTWVMMVIGLGFVGGVARVGRRRGHLTATASLAGTSV